MAEAALHLDGRSLTVDALATAARGGIPVDLSPQGWAQVDAGRAVVQELIDSGRPAYGVTTGFGSQKDYKVDAADRARFSRQVIIGHATVAGPDRLPDAAVRAGQIVLINAFATGIPGVSRELVQALLRRLSEGPLPALNGEGSVGASDLVPHAQAALAILGADQPLDGAAGNGTAYELKPKEALSLMNCNALSLGHAAVAAAEARRLARHLDMVAALSLEGFRGAAGAFDLALQRLHPQPGQAESLRRIGAMLQGSRLWQPGASRFLQDPLSFRCASQFHGTVHSALQWLRENLEAEINSAQDNPAVDIAERRLISCGNMDTSLISVGFDTLRQALTIALNGSANRLHKLHWPSFSGLPHGLAAEGSAVGGVQFLNFSHIAEAQAAIVRHAAQPVAATYQGQLADGVEDHGAFLPLAVQETGRLLQAGWIMLTLEALTAAWSVRRREVPRGALGRGAVGLFDLLSPHLPIGSEGEIVFDLRPLTALLRDAEPIDGDC